jgi:leucyl aminopeptidase
LPLTFSTARNAPRDIEVLGVPVFSEGPVPRSAGLSRKALAAIGFEGKAGQAAVIPQANGPDVVVVGMGDPGAATLATVRNAAAALARAAAKRASMATGLTQATDLAPAEVGQAIAEGFVLASHRYVAMKSDKSGVPDLERVVLLTDPARAKAVATGAERGRLLGEAVNLARDLINTPPMALTARDLAEVARQTAADRGLKVEVLEEDAMVELGLGGLLAVNKGSVEPPRLVKLTYTPRNPQGSIALVGKGITYDSGGISLKPSDAMHAVMKMDMSGAAAVLATLSVLPALKPKVKVTGYLCCTDNMPSGSAFKLGDVLTIRNGKTVEIHNTDAEGRLVLADGLSLAIEEKPDAVLDIATLTGAVMGALGTKLAGVMGNDQGLIEQVESASKRTDEKVWHLPLPSEYRKLLDSDVADMKNVGGPYGGALVAGLFLQEFVDGTPWAHLDIAGVMRSETDEGWLSKGGTGFGVRLLVDLICGFKPAT